MASLATARLRDGFHPATFRQYSRMWRDYISFQVAAGLRSFQMAPLVLLAYLEYLASSNLSQSNISNNLAAVRAFHIMHGLPTDSFKEERLVLFIKSLKLGRTFAPKIAQSVTVQTLLRIIETSKL